MEVFTSDDYFSSLFGSPEQIRNYCVYRYTHLDDLSFMRDAEKILGDSEYAGKALEATREVFRMNGWEGDGTIQLMWLPPFIGVGVEDTHGRYIWHVKQSNNGMSWLASPIPLPFERLLAQN